MVAAAVKETLPLLSVLTIALTVRLVGATLLLPGESPFPHEATITATQNINNDKYFIVLWFTF